MKTFVITSTRTNAGKTTVGAGLALNSGKKVGYLKPVGDRPVYKKDSLVDLDAEVFRSWLNTESDPEDCCIGFEYEMITASCSLHGPESTLRKRFDTVSEGSDLMLVETGRNYSFGGSMCMDSATLAKSLDSEIILVAQGNARLIIDKVLAASKMFKNEGAKLGGVIVNKLEKRDKTQFEETVKPAIEEYGIPVIGCLPHETSLERAKTSLVAEKLKAKLVAGAKGMDRTIDKVLVGALSADAAMKVPDFQTKNKMMITGGDRVDLILISLSENTSGIVLTNNIIPNPKILAQAEQYNVPVLSVPMDTFTTAKMVEHIVAELKPDDDDKKEIIKNIFAENIDYKGLLE